MKTPERFRINNGPMGSDISYGNNGLFIIPLSVRSIAFVICSDGEGWEHVSIHMIRDSKEDTPTWSEMCKIKDMFWDEEETVIQFHPPKSKYVNNHKHCLHLWRPIGKEIPLPDTSLIGILNT